MPYIRELRASRVQMTLRLGVLAVLCMLLGSVSIAIAQDCGGKATLTGATPVYARPASQFNTATGWVYGDPVVVLGANITVYVCADQTVQFGLVSQNWSRIAYWNKAWQHGWVVSQNVKRVGMNQPSSWVASVAQAFFLVANAHAEPQVLTENAPPGSGTPPPAAPTTASPGSAANGEDSALATFYAVLFACMVLGMLGKVLIDMLSDPADFNLKIRSRAFILPLVVSPIIFLGIMKAADATAAATLASFIAVACTAFQNGFFWHTIFDRTGSTEKKP